MGSARPKPLNTTTKDHTADHFNHVNKHNSIRNRIVMLARRCRRCIDMKSVLVLNFVCLLINLFFIVMQLNKGLWPIESFFESVLKTEDRTAMMTTLEKFVDALIASNITYIMYGGTLIGSYRHHGPIPWDDDVDIIVNGSDKSHVAKILTRLEPDYGLYTGGDVTALGQWKFYSRKTGIGYVHRPFRWPYIDVFFFRENDTHLWDETPIFKHAYTFPKSLIFPLQLRPFGAQNLYAPCNTRAVLAHNYKIELCRSRQFSHITEMPVFSFSTRDVPCTRLAHVHPFVHHAKLSDGRLNESLILGGWTLHSLVLPAACSE